MTFFLSLFSHKNLRNGENVLEIIDSVEDSKYTKEKFNFYKKYPLNFFVFTLFSFYPNNTKKL
jgi:hypothetical protein